MARCCFRCGKPLVQPKVISKNGRVTTTPFNEIADYIVAGDTVEDELREQFIAYKHTPETLAKAGKGETVKDEEYRKEVVQSVKEAVGAIKIVTEVKAVTIQKTGLICPECYRETDTVIWGVHKPEPNKLEEALPDGQRT